MLVLFSAITVCNQVTNCSESGAASYLITHDISTANSMQERERLMCTLGHTVIAERETSYGVASDSRIDKIMDR